MSYEDVFLTIASGLLIIIIISFSLHLIGIQMQINFCDYDSCSQESEYWEINGSKCFDETNPECKDFLRLWNYCQHYKQRIGQC